MTAPTALLDADVAVEAAACAWCGDRLVSPYLRRADGLGLHVGCATDYARAGAPAPAHPPT